jgi:DNA replication protein DnaC
MVLAIGCRAGINESHRPIGSFLFLGPTGEGKTELAKALAQFLLDDETRIVRLDMSEYILKQNINGTFIWKAVPLVDIHSPIFWRTS